MDIFVIEITDADSVHKKLLLDFKKKEITNPQKLNAHCLSYLMVDRILREFYRLEEREIIFDNNGKPLLKSGAKHFSISHSDDFIALAFSTSPCGVDIEKNTTRDFEKLAARMNFKSASQEDFYTDWTTYEATYKLGSQPQSGKTYKLGGYTLTAVSQNSNEDFEIYIQSGQYIPAQ